MQKKVYTINGRPLAVYLRDDADESVAAEIFALREYRRAEETIKVAKDAVVDGGAHSGLFTLYARSLNVTVPIISLEPEPQNMKLLRRHLEVNKITGVKTVEGALAKTYGKRKLMISKDSHNHRLLEFNEKDKKNIIVQGYSLSKIIQLCPSRKISLLKLDVEGGEYEVLEGASEGDLSRIKSIIMEYHDSRFHKHASLEEKLREHGFGVQTFPSKFDKTMGFLWAVNKRFYAA